MFKAIDIKFLEGNKFFNSEISAKKWIFENKILCYSCKHITNKNKCFYNFENNIPKHNYDCNQYVNNVGLLQIVESENKILKIYNSFAYNSKIKKITNWTQEEIIIKETNKQNNFKYIQYFRFKLKFIKFIKQLNKLFKTKML